jgi:hypothetical protein
MLDALEQAVGDDRLEGIQLQLSASAAMVMVTSLPMTSKAIWFTTSGNHRIDLARHDRRAGGARRQADLVQACLRAAEDSRRRSLQVFDSLQATRFNTPESWTNAPQS